MTTQSALQMAWPAGRHRRAGTADADPGVRLAPGERRLLRVVDRDGYAVSATDRAVYHRRHPTGWTRLGWEQVDRADWDPDRQVLTLAGLGPGGHWRTELPLADGLAPVLLARERIRWTILLTSTLPMGDMGEIPVVARRRPGTGALLWVLRLPPGIRPNDPRLSARVDPAIAALRALAGI